MQWKIRAKSRNVLKVISIDHFAYKLNVMQNSTQSNFLCKIKNIRVIKMTKQLKLLPTLLFDVRDWHLSVQILSAHRIAVVLVYVKRHLLRKQRCQNVNVLINRTQQVDVTVPVYMLLIDRVGNKLSPHLIQYCRHG